MKSLHICVLNFMFIVAIHTNLIKNGDFQNYVLDRSQAPHYLGKYLMTDYSDSYSWYNSPNASESFQVLNYLGDIKQGLDTLYSQDNRMACQDVELQKGKAYIIQFDYIVDSSAPKKFRALFNDEIIHEEDVPVMSINHYSNTIRASEDLGTLCFLGIFMSSRASANRGVIIDNVYMAKATVTQSIIFAISEDWMEKKLTLSSDFIIDSLQLMIFSETQIMIGDVNSPILGLSLGFLNNLEFVTSLDIQLNDSLLIKIILPYCQYVDQNGYSVQFIIMNTSNLVLELQPYQLQEQPITKQQFNNGTQGSWAQKQIVIDLFAYFLKAVNTLGLIGFTALVFRFVSFANIYILYIFLDIGYLDYEIRKTLENFADILLSRGLISSFSQLVLGQYVDLSFFKVQTIQKMPSTYASKGSSLHVINISTNLFDCCFEDFIVMVSNCLTILFVWFIVKKLKQNQSVQKFINNNLQDKVIKNALLIEVISVAPTWTLSAAVTFTSICVFASQDFLTKFNQSIFLLFPILMIAFWAPIQYYSKKYTKSLDIKMTSMKEKLSNPSSTNSQLKKQSSNKQLQKSLQQIKPLNHLFFVVFGFLIGLQNVYLFFMLITVYKITMVVLLWKRSELSFQYCATILQNIIKLTIHSSFLSLLIITKLTESKLLEDNQILEQSYIISLVIMYSYLSGICLEIIILIAELISMIVTLIKYSKPSIQNQENQEFYANQERLNKLKYKNSGIFRSNQVHNCPKQENKFSKQINLCKKTDKRAHKNSPDLQISYVEDIKHDQSIQKVYKIMKTQQIGEGNFKIIFSVSNKRQLPFRTYQV